MSTLQDEALGRLSQREREVLQLIARGLSYREIASRLHVAERTVETHLNHLREKLQVRSRQELVRVALGSGLLFEDSPEQVIPLVLQLCRRLPPAELGALIERLQQQAGHLKGGGVRGEG